MQQLQHPRLIAAAALLAALLAICWPGLAQEQAAGTIAKVKGNATLVRKGRNLKVTQAMALEEDDKLVTGPDGHLTITFGDNSSLMLGESASIVIGTGAGAISQGAGTAAGGGISRVSLMGGHLHSIFNAGMRRLATGFEVRTPNAIIGVRGTEFDTAYIAGTPCPGFPNCTRYTDVGVYKGRVEVSNPLNPKARPVIATAGYETTVPCEEPPATPSPLGMDQMLAPAYR